MTTKYFRNVIFLGMLLLGVVFFIVKVINYAAPPSENLVGVTLEERMRNGNTSGPNQCALKDSWVAFAQYGNGVIPISFFSKQISIAEYHGGIAGYRDKNGLLDVFRVHEGDFIEQNFYAYKPNHGEFVEMMSYEDIFDQEIPFYQEVPLLYSNVPDGFMAEATKKSYTIEEQEDIPQAYFAHIDDLLERETEKLVPAVIQTIWQVDMDHDGQLESIVEGTNNAVSNDDDSLGDPTKYEDESIVAYQILTLYSNTVGIRDFYVNINVLDIGTGGTMLSPLDLPEEDQSTAYSCYNLYLKDNTGEIVRFPLYTVGECFGMGADQLIVCDINGDGLYDICTFTGTEYPSFMIYLQTDDKDFNEPLIVVFPA